MTPRVLLRRPEGEGAPIDDRIGAHYPLDSRQRHHLIRVLRLTDGATVQAFDGCGRRWSATLGSNGESAWLTLGASTEATAESPLVIRLGQCLSSADKMDWTIEKAVELGVRSISPLFSQRSQIRIDGSRAQKKLDHWHAIIEAACVQSGRDVLPTIDEAGPLSRWLSTLDEPVRLVLDPNAPTPLSQWVRRSAPLTGSICLLAGPESGLSDAEMSAAHAAGFTSVRIGSRVLRTETAGLAAVAALQALAGDF